jgi:hypothetical protein
VAAHECITCNGGAWRVVACNLATGVERAVLHPVSFDFENKLNDYGQGTLTLVTRETLARDIWPHLTSIYFLRIGGPDATIEEPVVEFAALVEKFSASDNNTTSVGLKSIDSYLNNRVVRRTLDYESQPQTNIAASLVNYTRTATPRGIPLRGVADVSRIARDRHYDPWDRKNVGEAVVQLCEVINGPDWELQHLRSAQGAWRTDMIFRDHVGGDRDMVLKSDREASAYSLDVDAANHATLVDALGAGEEENMLIATAVDDADVYPQFDATPAWKDIKRIGPLQNQADGYLDDYKEPIATPSVEISGYDPAPSLVRLGDTVAIETNFGAVTYKGRMRLTSISWKVSADAVATRAYEGEPTTRASDSVLNQVPDEDCEECD